MGTIAPEIYGHFVEHLGAVVYDGIWVGEDSRVPNVGGIRKQIIDALKPMSPGVIRWPGGCFADQYDWRDGSGPRKQRPRRTNFWAGSPEWPKDANRNGAQVYDPNQFGTVEFCRFCKLTGAAAVSSRPTCEAAGAGLLALGRVLQLARWQSRRWRIYGPPMASANPLV